ncbi:hypothetical protein B0H11DRAFT_2251843 [Mycena galericulata]|nr:hypothetical protein B0H11DRAFT_2251843 [Mycena galericulata]
MSSCQSRRRTNSKPAASTSNSHSHSHRLTLEGPAEDAPITTFVDRMSNDKRRVYREEFPVEPPSPVKRARIDAAAPPPCFPPSGSCDDSLAFERYELPHDGDPEPLDTLTGLPLPPGVKPFKYSDPILFTWRPKIDTYVAEFIRLEGRGGADIDVCPGCTDGTPLFRCKDCHGGTMYCQACIVEKHRENPLHRIQRWTAGFFQKTSLSALGLRVQLGHRLGDCCWAPEPAKKGFVTLHTNGIHEVLVDFCGCSEALEAGPPEVQLLRAGWFPASHVRPHTCATLTVLEQFHLETVQAKTTMYDFYGVLEKLTDNTGSKPPDRYHEWIRMCREFRILKMLKRGGRATAYDLSGADGTQAGALAIECPACPRPGVNLADDWEDTPEEEKHKVTLYLGLDACFRLKRRLVSSELKDPDLGSGWAYMVENAPYREYLRGVTDQKEMATCSGLAALDYANTKFSRGYSTTGVGMGVCARHEFIQPNGVGDLQRGERFANMDYIFGSILRHKHPRLRKFASYDIVCIWSVFLEERLKQLPPLVRLRVILGFNYIFRFVIPKMHIHSHTLMCQLWFSLNLILGSAQVDGEGIERPWASIGGVATSTRDMGPAARHGVLDYQWGHWNWQKLVGIVALLRRRMDNAKEELARQKETFKAFSEEQADRVPAWKKIVHDFEANPKADGVKNPYEVKVVGLTEAQVRLEFTKEEAAEAARGIPSIHDVTPSKFLAAGLDLKEEQRRVRVQAELKKANTTGMQINLGEMRTALNRRILRFRKLQATYTPAALQILGEAADDNDPNASNPENVPLVLPSAMTVAQRATCRSGLGAMEALMRQAQCRSALVRLRNQLHIKSRLLRYKKSHARHQKRNTRSRAIVTRNESKIRLHSEKYQMAWEALRILDGNGDGKLVGWTQLKRDDIRCMEDEEDLERKARKRDAEKARKKKKVTELREHGMLPAEDDGDGGDSSDDEIDEGSPRRGAENRRQVSWIWTVTGASGTDSELEDALRIEWSKAYARMRRWSEEVDVLEAEYWRVKLSFAWEALRWDRRAEAVAVGVLQREEAEGARAYAKRQAAMFRALGVQAEATWTAPKLTRGKRRPRAPAEVVDEGEDREEEEREREQEEEEEELMRGDVASDEEFIMGGEDED